MPSGSIPTTSSSKTFLFPNPNGLLELLDNDFFAHFLDHGVFVDLAAPRDNAQGLLGGCFRALQFLHQNLDSSLPWTFRLGVLVVAFVLVVILRLVPRIHFLEEELASGTREYEFRFLLVIVIANGRCLGLGGGDGGGQRNGLGDKEIQPFIGNIVRETLESQGHVVGIRLENFVGCEYGRFLVRRRLAAVTAKEAVEKAPEDPWAVVVVATAVAVGSNSSTVRPVAPTTHRSRWRGRMELKGIGVGMMRIVTRQNRKERQELEKTQAFAVAAANAGSNDRLVCILVEHTGSAGAVGGSSEMRCRTRQGVKIERKLNPANSAYEILHMISFAKSVKQFVPLGGYKIHCQYISY